MAWGGGSKGGLERIFCAEDPFSAGGGGSSGNATLRNVFAGQTLYVAPSGTPSRPSLSLGTADFAIECVVRRRSNQTAGVQDGQQYTGLLAGASPANNVANIEWIVASGGSDASINFDADGDGVGGISGGFFDYDTTWRHFAVNFDRSANMETFRSGVSVDTTSIAAQSATAILDANGVYPLQGRSSAVGDWDVLPEDPTSVFVLPAVIALFAIHNRLMTATEITDASNALGVHNFGAATTLVLYNWEGYVGAEGIELETDQEKMSTGMKDGIAANLSGTLGTPRVATGEYQIEDISGNRNHWPLTTLATYETTPIASRAVTGLITDVIT